jgi:hypothetical protein
MEPDIEPDIDPLDMEPLAAGGGDAAWAKAEPVMAMLTNKARLAIFPKVFICLSW